MRAVPILLLAAFGCALVSGCPSRDPWAGVDAREFARLEEHRLVGIALLENGGNGALPDGKRLQALDEFQAIRRIAPGLAPIRFK